MSSNNLRNNELEFTPTFGTQLELMIQRPANTGSRPKITNLPHKLIHHLL